MIVSAFLLMLLVIACLAIGWIMTGKVRLRRGGCGMIPKEGKKNSPCSICGADKVCEEEEEKKK